MMSSRFLIMVNVHGVISLLDVFVLCLFSSVKEYLPGNGKECIYSKRYQQDAEKIMFHKVACCLSAFQKNM